MRIVMDTQVRLTEFKNSFRKDMFLESVKSDNIVVVNEKTIFLWDYIGSLDNEKVFNTFIMIDNIIVLIDSETQIYEAFRDGIRFDHAILKDLVRWVKIKYMGDKKRLLRIMSNFRNSLIQYNLNFEYYRGIYSDRFSIKLNKKELLIIGWSKEKDVKLLGLEETFSFFIKTCKIIL